MSILFAADRAYRFHIKENDIPYVLAELVILPRVLGELCVAVPGGRTRSLTLREERHRDIGILQDPSTSNHTVSIYVLYNIK